MVATSTPPRVRRVVLSAAFAVLISGCAGDGEEPPARRATQGKAGAVTVNDYDPANFSDPTNVDNPYSPRRPGMRWVWEGKALDDEGNPVDRRVEMVVSDMTKVLNGVPAVVAIDKDYNDGEIGEYELIFFSQDDQGTVWLHGYYSEEWEEGKRVGASGWLGGVQDAKSGIYMHAQPAVETPAYEQGIPPVEHEAPDYAEVFQTGQRTCTPIDCYQNVVVTREWHPSEPGVYQVKYYAPGVGNVRIGYLGPDDPEKEQMTLTEFERMGPEELAKVREEVRALEERAYKFSKDFYGETEPAEQAQEA